MKVWIGMVAGDRAPRAYSGLALALNDLSDDIFGELLSEYMTEGGGVDYQAIHRDAEGATTSPFGDDRSLSIVLVFQD
jgi:hypothetical protein